MTQFLRKQLRQGTRAAVWCVTNFVITLGLNYLHPRVVLFFQSLWWMLILIWIVSYVTSIWQRNKASSKSEKGPDVPDGRLGLISAYVSALIGIDAAIAPQSAGLFISSYSFSQYTDMGVRLVQAISMAAALSMELYWIEAFTRRLRRHWLGKELQDALHKGKDDFTDRRVKFDKALPAFVNDIPAFMEIAEGRGESFIRLTFDGRDGANSPYGLERDDLGWPDGTWLSKCHEQKFVHLACLSARGQHLVAEVIRRYDKRGYCLELRW